MMRRSMGSGSKVVVVVVVVVAGWIILSSMVCSAQEQGDCMKKCIHDCYSNRAGMCAFNCALNCKWPFAQPTGEVLISEAASPLGDEATKAAFDPHDHDEQQTPPPTTSQSHT